MKKLALLILLSPLSAMACGNLNDFNVSNLDFKNVTVRDAVRNVLQTTDFEVVYGENLSTKRLSADAVSGPVGDVLDALSREAGITYSQEGCTVKIKSANTSASTIKTTVTQGLAPKEVSQKAKPDTALVIAAGQSISERVRVWARQYGYDVAWDGDYRSSMNIRIDKGFNETLESLANSLRNNGFNLDFTVYDNKVVRIIESK